MPGLLISFALMIFTVPEARADAVRIGLFSLFRPEVVEVRIITSQTAALDSHRISGSRPLAAGCRVRFQLIGDQVQVTVIDAFSSRRQAFITNEARIHANDAITMELSLPGKLHRVVRG